MEGCVSWSSRGTMHHLEWCQSREKHPFYGTHHVSSWEYWWLLMSPQCVWAINGNLHKLVKKFSMTWETKLKLVSQSSHQSLSRMRAWGPPSSIWRLLSRHRAAVTFGDLADPFLTLEGAFRLLGFSLAPWKQTSDLAEGCFFFFGSEEPPFNNQ